MRDPLNSKQLTLTKELYEDELNRVKLTTSSSVHNRAVDRYKKELIAVLKKLNPRHRYWL